jgi:hypothetical protein
VEGYEEVLEHLFTALLGRLQFDDEILSWLQEAHHVHPTPWHAVALASSPKSLSENIMLDYKAFVA